MLLLRSSIYGCNSNIAVYKESTAGNKWLILFMYHPYTCIFD